MEGNENEMEMDKRRGPKSIAESFLNMPDSWMATFMLC